MKLKIRKIVTFEEEIFIEGGKEASQTLKLFGVAAVVKNPWSGHGFVDDLKPEIKLKDFKDLITNKYEIELDKKAEENQFKSFIASQKNFKKIESSRQIKNTDKVIVNFESSQEDLPEYLKSQKNFPIDLDFDDGILPGLNKELILSLIHISSPRDS